MIDKKIQMKRFKAMLKIFLVMVGMNVSVVAIILMVTDSPMIVNRVIYLTSISSIIGWLIVAIDNTKKLAE